MQVGAVDGMLEGFQSYTSKHDSAGVCWQKVEHLGRVSCEEETSNMELHHSAA